MTRKNRTRSDEKKQTSAQAVTPVTKIWWPKSDLRTTRRLYMFLCVLLGISYMGFRLWGISQRGLTNLDVENCLRQGRAVVAALKWYSSEERTGGMSLPDYAAQLYGSRYLASFESTGKDFSALFFALALVTFDDVLLGWSLMGVLAGSVTIILVAGFSRRYFGAGVCLLTMLLSVAHGMEMNVTGRGYNFVPSSLFTVAACYALMRGLEDGGRRFWRWLAVSGVSFGTAYISHYTIWTYTPVFIGALVFSSLPIRKRLLGIPVWTALMLLPFLGLWGVHEYFSGIGGYDFDYFKSVVHVGFTSTGTSYSVRYFGDFWYMQRLFDGSIFSILMYAGILSLAVIHIHDRWRLDGESSPARRLWRVLLFGDEPRSFVGVLVLWGLILWAPYHYKAPRNLAETVFLWPLMVAALFFIIWHHLLRGLKTTGIAVLVAICVAVSVRSAIVASDLVYIARGLRDAYEFVVSQGKTCWGRYTAWPCERTGIAVPYGWELKLGDILAAQEGLDYWLHDYSFEMHMSAHFHPVGRMVYFEMCNELARNFRPAYRKPYVGHLQARTENSKIELIKYWEKHPLAPYVDVWNKQDVINAHRIALDKVSQHLARAQAAKITSGPR